eukprot:125684-Karenia_brevis.AAC.1
MLTDMRNAMESVGLQLHPGKMKILTNATKRTGRHNNTHVNVEGLQTEVLPRTAKITYLGRSFTFDEPHATELDNRIRKGWA